MTVIPLFLFPLVVLVAYLPSLPLLLDKLGMTGDDPRVALVPFPKKDMESCVVMVKDWRFIIL